MTNVTDADGQDEGARESAAAPEPAASAVSGDAPQAAAGESASSPEAGSGAASPAAASGVTAVFGIDWDALAALLATAASAASASPLPPYRRIWFQSLIRQGREAESQGRAALAAHCFARLEQEFKAFGIAGIASIVDIPARNAVSGGAFAEFDDAPGPAKSRDYTASGTGHAAAGETFTGADAAQGGDPAALPSSQQVAPHSPLRALAARRDLAARASLRELLDRHASRLSPGEVAAFRHALEGAPQTGAAPLKPATAAGAAAAGGGPSISELRRRLVDRLMRAARYRRHAARLGAWKPAPAEGVAGPYNDYRVLEDMLHRIASSNPLAAEWAAEFFDIYADMRDLRAAYGSILPGK